MILVKALVASMLAYVAARLFGEALFSMHPQNPIGAGVVAGLAVGCLFWIYISSQESK